MLTFIKKMRLGVEVTGFFGKLIKIYLSVIEDFMDWV